jgi:hypothetical protein
VGFWGIPHMEGEVSYAPIKGASFSVKHNAQGNRDKEWLEDGRKGGRGRGTIVCAGGSHTWGIGIDQESRYTERLEAFIGQRVVNMGHCSLGLDQICLVLMERARMFSPSIVVVEQYPWAVHRVLSTYVNGYVRPYFYLDVKNELKLQKMPKLSRFNTFRRVVGSFYNYRKEFSEYNSGINLKEGYNPLLDPIFLYWKVHHYDYMYQLVDMILRVIRDFCRQEGIKLIFALGAIAQQFEAKSQSVLVDYDLPRKRLIRLLEKNRIPFVDMTAPFLSGHTSEEPVIFPDGHMNAKGHEIFALTLQRELQHHEWITV